MPKFEQPPAPPPEEIETEEEVIKQPTVSAEVREIKIKGKKRDKPSSAEATEGKLSSIETSESKPSSVEDSRGKPEEAKEAAEEKPKKKPEKKKSRTSKKAKKLEIAEVLPGPEPEKEPFRPYAKEEWLEIAETLKEQAAVWHEKEKIEEKEEIIELTRDMIVAEEKPEKEIFNLYKQIREARREVAESEVEWKLRGGDFEKYQKNQKTKEDYGESQRRLLESFLTKAEKRWGRDSEKFVEFKNHLIFKGFVGRERERLIEAKEDALPKKEKSRFRKLFEKVAQNYAKLPKGVRWGIAAGLGTAVTFGTGGVAAPALLGYAGFRYGRAALASMSVVGAKALGDAAEKIWLEKYGKEAREEKIKAAVEKETRGASDFEILSHYLAVQKDRRNKELAKLVRRQKLWWVGKMAAMIGAGGGIAFWAGSVDAFTNETGVSKGIQEQLGIKGEKPVMPLPEETPAVKLAPEVAEPTFALGQFVETVKPGDSIWRLAERQLENQGYFKNLSGTAEEIAAKKTYLTDWAKDQIAKNPEKFGLSDPDQLVVGQKIDFSDIFKNKEGLLKAFGDTEKLSAGQLAHINNNNELISEWVKNHPGERLTSGKVAEILGGKRLEILLQEVPSAEEIVSPEEKMMSWEDYSRSAPPEQKELDLAGWEDYTNLPELNEEEMRSLEDYYENQRLIEELEGDRQAAETAEALKKFHVDQLRVYNDITEILAPSNMRPAEFLAIKNVSVGKFLEETAGGWEKWRSDEAITIDLSHDGVYGAGEYGRQLKLAEFIKNTNPTMFDKTLTIEEYLKQFVK